MSPSVWRQFLSQYSEELLRSNDPRIDVPGEARATGWMGFEQASFQAIETTERRLGRRLPESLRNFYSVTNGWRATGFFIYDVLPVEQIDWLQNRTQNRDNRLYQIACDTEDPPDDKPRARWKDDPDGSRQRKYRFEEGTRLKRSLVISSWGDAAIWLLDPGDHDHDGEWPAGRWASWNPGLEWTAESFGDLMRQELACFVRLRDNVHRT